jgi:two-component sensor histidine kinase/AmiR/NasT family two-component response regulator
MADLKTLLLVEDQAIIASREADMLRKEGYALVLAQSGEEAIAIVKTAHQEIDLILMDVDLGQHCMDGVQAAQEILKDRDIPVIFLHTNTAREVVEKIEKTTSYGYFIKNGDISVLGVLIKLALKLHTANQILRRTNEAQHRALISEMFAGFALHKIICDDDGTPVDYVTVDVNKAFETLLGTPREAVTGIKASDILPQEELDHWLGIFGPVALTGKPTNYEMYSSLNGKYFEGSVYCPEKGKFAVTFMDVTERKQAEALLLKNKAELQGYATSLQHSLQEKEMLMRELQHRVKNSLTIASSLLGLEEDNLPDERTRAIFASTQNRLRSISSIYELLYRSGEIDRINIRQYIENLVNELSQAYLQKAGTVTIEVEVETIQFDVQRTLALGLILNELITNALKYAFPAGSSPHGGPGTIRVELSQTGEQVKLRVIDNGIGPGIQSGPDDFPRGGGMGLELVKMMTQDMNGRFTLENDDGATACVMFPR